MQSNACVQCYKAPKNPEHRFCSAYCSYIAASNAPSLLNIRPDNDLYKSVETKFRDSWAQGVAPRIKAIYMVTWSQQSQDEFYQYRTLVESRGQFVRNRLSPGNERKYFRGATRACTIGENGNKNICSMPSCKLCETLRFGFGPYLVLKQTIGCNGTRLGAGIYSSPNPAKASNYAINLHPSSTTKVMMLCRVVVGNRYETKREEQSLFRPPQGFDSVYGLSGPHSSFKSDECVVYTQKAIRPAYLIVY